MRELVLNVIAKYGYYGVGFLIFLENVFPPLPSEVILLFGGFMVGYAELNLIIMVLFATLGSLLGALVLYYIGSFFSVIKIKKIVNGKAGKILRLKEEDIDKANIWVEKKNNKAVFLCRFLPIVRSLISIPAGMSKMNIGGFCLYTFIGSFIWNIALICIGDKVGKNWEVVSEFFNDYSFLVIVTSTILAIILLITFYINRIKKQKDNFN